MDGHKRTELTNEVTRRVSEEDLEEPARKNNYEDELFTPIDFAHINTFTKKPFSGNPAAVCVLPYERNDEWLKLIAKEFNLPATAFVIKRRQSKRSMSAQSEGSPLIAADETGTELKPVKWVNHPVGNEFDIRWFSTDAELGLCGHATLASAHMLFSSGMVKGDTIIFHSKKGTLRAAKVAGYHQDDEEPSVDRGNKEANVLHAKTVELGKGVVELDFPLSMAAQVDLAEAGRVSDALEVAKAVWVGRNELGDYLVEVSSSKEVELLRPNYQKIKELGGRSVIATARAPAEREIDVISRVFAPNLGINEDSVTGSVHTTIGPYWAAKLGKNTLEAYQASARGGHMTVRVDDCAGRVFLQGGAVTLMAGTLVNTFCV
ncbi:hypothetical protein R1sor_011777 [Riccia sorocarpa]|uniref:Phenazine biosynthesis PhzC/PhzF protein n=1 Tax=Riccia sorocarpa TaxID=122646 RepID=A0ABD3I2W0_9MARC